MSSTIHYLVPVWNSDCRKRVNRDKAQPYSRCNIRNARLPRTSTVATGHYDGPWRERPGQDTPYLFERCLDGHHYRPTRRPYIQTESGMNTTRMARHHTSDCQPSAPTDWPSNSERTAFTKTDTG